VTVLDMRRARGNADAVGNLPRVQRLESRNPAAEEPMLSQRYAASGTITQRNKVVEASGVLGRFDTQHEAELAGLDWARAWVDGHA
jgi:hypothetical protein